MLQLLSRKLTFRPSTASVDAWYTGYAATVPAMAGSLLTFMYFGGGLWALMNAAVRRYTLALPPRAVPFVIACLGFPVVMALAGVMGENRDELPRELLSTSAFLFVPLLIARYRSSDPVRSLSALSVYAPLGAAAGLAMGLMQVFRDMGAASGGAGNPAVYGTAMVLLGALSLTGTFRQGRWARAAAIGGFLSGMAGLLISETRTLYPMLVLLPLLAVLVNPTRKLVGLAAMALVLASSIIFFYGDRLAADYREASRDVQLVWKHDVFSGSLGLRVALWSAAVDAFDESPLLGHGPQNKMETVVRHLNEGVSFARFNHVHNGLLDAAVSAGSVGVLAFLAVMLSPLRMVVGRKNESRPRRFIVLSTWSVFALTAITGTPFDHDLLLVMFLLPLVIAAASDPDPHDIVFWRGRKARLAELGNVSTSPPR